MENEAKPTIHRSCHFLTKSVVFVLLLMHHKHKLMPDSLVGCDCGVSYAVKRPAGISFHFIVSWASFHVSLEIMLGWVDEIYFALRGKGCIGVAAGPPKTSNQ